MEVSYQYTKRRYEFGRHCNFSDGESQVLKSILPTDDYDADYVHKLQVITEFDTSPHSCEREMNTDKVEVKSTSMWHGEGGWPKDVDVTEQSDMARYRKRVEKNEAFQASVIALGPVVSNCMLQNNTINVYEKYDPGERDSEVEIQIQPPSIKGIAVFRDPTPVKRSVSSIDWHPDGTRFAVSYSIMTFQDEKLQNVDMQTNSFIWSISDSNAPIAELCPPTHLTCLKFNPKSTDTLVGGTSNGLICFFDLRKSNAINKQGIPSYTSIALSTVALSHHDAVCDIFWVKAKHNFMCASCSSDGQILWWDTRDLQKPTDSLEVAGRKLSCMEYSQDLATKYLLGSEEGNVFLCNLRNRKQENGGVSVFSSNPSMTGDADGTSLAQHHAPIYALQRNPTHNKFFMTIGDWSARIWSEDVKNPIMITNYQTAYLTGGCWSPSRPGVFFTTRMDGVLDVWDLQSAQNQVTYSHKLGNEAISALSVQGGSAWSVEGKNPNSGELAAVGDANGTVHILKLCKSLYALQTTEKLDINNLFERELRREKNYEAQEKEEQRVKALKRKNDESTKKETAESDQTKAFDILISQTEKAFMEQISDEEDDLEDKSAAVSQQKENSYKDDFFEQSEAEHDDKNLDGTP